MVKSGPTSLKTGWLVYKPVPCLQTGHVCNQFTTYMYIAIFVDCHARIFTSQSTSTAEPHITQVCVNCTGINCRFDCSTASSNSPFRINNIVPGENYTISLSLRNDFGQSGQTTPELFGENKAVYWGECEWAPTLMCSIAYIICICDTLLCVSLTEA